jgi:hypothetical protein
VEERMTGLSAQLPALVGVVVGAASSYLATSATERARWKRQTRVRWDEQRAIVYTEYGHAVIRCVALARRVASGRGVGHYPHPLTLDDGRTELSAAEAEREVRWESVLLLGSAEAILAARLWHRTVWTLRRAALGELDTDWSSTLAEAGHRRRAFYEAARRDLGVEGSLPDVGDEGL